MTKEKQVIDYCNTFPEVYEDQPFGKSACIVMRHQSNKKVFAWIFRREEYIWVNVKCDPEWRDFWRGVYTSVVPGYHLNKKYWNSIILDGTVPEEEIKKMITESYQLTR